MGFHALAFAKKSPLTLTRGIKSRVNEVYSNSYPHISLPSSAAGPRSRVRLKIAHVTFHTIPTQMGVVALLLLFSIWCLYYSVESKVISLFGALAYTVAESAFTYFERGAPYTSFGQFFANLLYIPLLLDGYPFFLSLLPQLFPPPYLFVLLYPLNIWFLEIVEEIFLIKTIYGRNVAWIYEDYSDEYLEGCIRIGHAPVWWALGAGVYYFLATFREDIEAIVG
mmetsp:Transcript_28688/g.54167  ORF Transcript_28688/g.54167 Transcript_28688/m.54167 type:complete len:224 (+) Transcript_28688:133-804(+)